jgi:hypothetical protein
MITIFFYIFICGVLRLKAQSTVSVSSTGERWPIFDLKNMISTYTKDLFSMKKMTQIRQILKRIFFQIARFL